MLLDVYKICLSATEQDAPWSQLVQFSSVTQLCPTLCNPVNRSMPGLPVHHQLPELTQTHVHGISDAIQSSHPLSSPSPPTFNLSQHGQMLNQLLHILNGMLYGHLNIYENFIITGKNVQILVETKYGILYIKFWKELL